MVVIKKNIVYDHTFNLQTDIYFPNETGRQTKILLLWHGGSWLRGSKNEEKRLGVRLANAGFMTLVPDYRLAPTAIFPAAHQDSIHFVEWLLASKYTDAEDEKNIVQLGISCGGTMALYVAGQYGFPTVTWSAPVSFSKWLAQHPDICPSSQPKEELGLTDSTQIKASFYKNFVLSYAPTKQAQEELDAENYGYTKLGHLLMLNSTQELTPLADVLTFAKKLATKGHELNLLLIPGTRHGRHYGDDYIDESIDFLKRSDSHPLVR